MAEDTLTYVVGAERGVQELLSGSDVRPLLLALVQAGAASALLTDDEGEELWGARHPPLAAEETVTLPLVLEGEPVGALRVCGERARRDEVAALARLVGVALDTMLKSNLKRALTTEIHTTVVQSSYEELAAKNRALAESEARYRELAEGLEIRVKERTSELHRAHARILQQEKMAAIGGLAAGVAHEINTPLGFITSNLHTLQKYVGRLTAMLFFYREHLKGTGYFSEKVACPPATPCPPAADTLDDAAQKKWQELKLTRVLDDLPDLLSQSLAGAERVTRIVADLKGFSHVDDAAEMPVDLNEELERTVGVLAHQLAGKAQIVRELEPLPRVVCPPQLPGQIFLNILQNALATGAPGLRITLTSSCDGGRIAVTIADNGPGVPDGIKGRIFEPFFTTREVGCGTGMGLAVVYDAVAKLGGTVAVADAPGGGAAFTVTVPLGKE